MILIGRSRVWLEAPELLAYMGGAEGTRTPDPHTASARTVRVTGGIRRFHCARLAANSASLAVVGSSSGPKLGPTNDDASDVSQEAGPQDRIRSTGQPPRTEDQLV